MITNTKFRSSNTLPINKSFKRCKFVVNKNTSSQMTTEFLNYDSPRALSQDALNFPAISGVLNRTKNFSTVISPSSEK